MHQYQGRTENSVDARDAVTIQNNEGSADQLIIDRRWNIFADELANL